LLRLAPSSLQRLRKSRSKIAATVMENLNEILAERLCDLTKVLAEQSRSQVSAASPRTSTFVPPDKWAF